MYQVHQLRSSLVLAYAGQPPLRVVCRLCMALHPVSGFRLKALDQYAEQDTLDLYIVHVGGR